jgi:hypothetical protein
MEVGCRPTLHEPGSRKARCAPVSVWKSKCASFQGSFLHLGSRRVSELAQEG